jgi:hypothetical protein
LTLTTVVIFGNNKGRGRMVFVRQWSVKSKASFVGATMTVNAPVLGQRASDLSLIGDKKGEKSQTRKVPASSASFLAFF